MVRCCTRERTTTSPLGDYLREIRDHDLLTADEEVELARGVKAGDEDARSRLIRANLRLVVKVARDFEGRGLALEDLVGEGNLGLIRAAMEFDPRFGTRFSTYASHWIKQAIRHALITTTATIRLPAHMVGLLTKWRRAERAYLREFGHAPSFEHLAVSLGLSEAKRRMVEQALLACRLMPGSGGEADEGGALDEAAAPHEAPGMSMEVDDDRRDLLRRLERLDDRERTILTLRFGLEGREPMTLKEIGRRLGVTREWVRKIEVRAVRKLDDVTPPTAPAARRPSAAGRPRRTRQPALQSA
ncbi:sigma-70 family RNA polymerase sigma factor [Tautonia plasticadhaerens]|uniref:RNA polymerase sigma factor SigA n=1 Tax=Tautonia plasticadhaerens TaxID=2527974 RepID=A0A518H5B4_9BACT|nr:RNA polymerase sigma factor RpoD/SigA [Tautonia plasticadhaerens]QDV36031.1 RNA polymerase sigma factor SigA [Tautonia plasticadhaerens]